MGRTLHYGLRSEYTLSDEQEQQLIDLSKRYNKEYEWTCESVWLSSLDYYPNWINFSGSTESVWETVNKKYEELIASGLNDVDTIRMLKRLGYVYFHHDKGELRGFTKVSGNELNAHTVIKFIVEVSHILKDQILYLHDEGDALYCDILIKNGEAKPDKRYIKDTLDYWNREWDYLKNYGNCKAKRKYLEAIIKNEDWQDINNFIRPLKQECYLINREKFKTQNINAEDVLDLKSLCADFIARESAESAEYYDDLNCFG